LLGWLQLAADRSAVTVSTLILVLLFAATAALLRRAHLTRLLPGLITLTAFLLVLARSLAAALLLIRAHLILALLSVSLLLLLLLLIPIGFVARLLSAIPFLRVVTLVRHEKSPR
jgi:hypothetical protein